MASVLRSQFGGMMQLQPHLMHNPTIDMPDEEDNIIDRVGCITLLNILKYYKYIYFFYFFFYKFSVA